MTNNCTQTCTRTVSNGTSSYECGCNQGYELNPDNTTCDGKCVCDMRQNIQLADTVYIAENFHRRN